MNGHIRSLSLSLPIELYLIAKLCAEKSPSEWMRPVSTLHWDFAGLLELWAAGRLLCCCGDEWKIIKFNIRFLFIFLPFSFLGHHTTHHRSANLRESISLLSNNNNIRTRGRHPLTSSCYYDTNQMDLFGRFRIIRPCVPSSNHAHSSVPFGISGEWNRIPSDLRRKKNKKQKSRGRMSENRHCINHRRMSWGGISGWRWLTCVGGRRRDATMTRSHDV